jgi:SAM-dependent methyltransferase
MGGSQESCSWMICCEDFRRSGRAASGAEIDERRPSAWRSDVLILRHGSGVLGASGEVLMAESSRHDAWQEGESYDAYMGRWSRCIAPLFLDRLEAAEGLDWLDVGCGTGALSEAILAQCGPRSVVGVDPSPGFISQALETVRDPRATFQLGDAQALPVGSATFDLVVSGLMLNFVPDRLKALEEMKRAARPNGRVCFYVWDYPGGGVEFMRAFWQAAASLDPDAALLSEARRFAFCEPSALTELARAAGLASIACEAIEAPTVFRDFDDYWRPFALGAGPAPGYCSSLSPDKRERLRLLLRERLPAHEDGSITLRVRAWAVTSAVA